LRARVELDTKAGKNPTDARKVHGVIHWVDAATSVPAEIRVYDRLFKSPRPEDGGGDFLEHLDPNSLEVIHGARLEPSLATAAVGSRWQLERVGYFIVDEDSTPKLFVLNRIVTLRDATRVGKAPEVPAERPRVMDPGASASEPKRPANVKAKTRPKSK